MADKRLIDFINKSLKRGVKEQNIFSALVKKGWNKDIVNNAFSFVKGSQKKKTQEDPFKDFDISEKTQEKLPEKTQKKETSEKEKKKEKKSPIKEGENIEDKKTKDTSKKETEIKGEEKKEGKNKDKQLNKKELSDKEKNFQRKEISIKTKENPFKSLAIIVILTVILVGVFVFFGFSSKTLTEDDLTNGTTIVLEEGEDIGFSLEGPHKLTVEQVLSDKVFFKIEGSVFNFSLSVGEEKKLDFGGDGDYDLLVRLESISEGAKIYLSKLTQSFCEEEWECTEWSSCIEGFQERNCTDINKCGTSENIPREIRPCETNISETSDASEENFSTCSAEGGIICNETESCLGNWINASDTSYCCSDDCINQTTQNESLSQGEKLCLNLEGNICDEPEYCNSSEIDISGDDVVCCEEECIPAASYFGTPFTNVEWNDSLNSFKNNATYCEEGYSILVNLSTANLNYKTGINISKNVKFKIKGVDSQGECEIKSDYRDYSLNYTEEMRDYLLQRGNTSEEISQEIEELNSDIGSYIGSSVECKYPVIYLEDKIDEWRSGNYSLGFEDSNGKFEEFNCQGDELAPLIV